MNRSEGLVRRNKSRPSDDGSETNGNATNSDIVNDNFKDDETDEAAEECDKETRLTLMEEVLLLGLKDKEVSCNNCLKSPYLHNCLLFDDVIKINMN